MTERDKLVKQLKELLGHEKLYDPEAEVVADFILADRARILRILVQGLIGLIDYEACSFDHHGYCQTHFSGSSPCLMVEARKALKLALGGSHDKSS